MPIYDEYLESKKKKKSIYDEYLESKGISNDTSSNLINTSKTSVKETSKENSRSNEILNKMKQITSKGTLTDKDKSQLEEYKKQLDNNKTVEPIYSTETLNNKYGEMTKVTTESLKSDEKAEERSNEINKAIEDKDYLRAGGYILEGLGEGIRSSVAGLGQAGLSLGALKLQQLENNTKNEKAKEKLSDWKNKLLDNAEYLKDNTSYYQKATSGIDNGIVRTSGQVSNTIGEMIPSIGANIVAPGSGVFVSGIQEMGQSTVDNLNSDRSNLGKSVISGTGKGIIAGVSEKIVGGDFISEGITDKLAAKGISKITGNKVAKKVLWKVYQVMGEQAEEILEDSVGDLIDKVVNDKKLPSWKEWKVKEGETAKVTALSTLVLSALGLGGGDIDTTFNEGRTNNEQKVYDKLLSDKTTKLREQKTIDTMIQQNKETLSKAYGRDLTTEEINEIADAVKQVNQAGKLDTENTNLTLKEKTKIENEIKQDLEDGNLDINTIRDILGENVDISKDILLQRSLYENSQKYNDYQAELTGNEKVDKFLQSAAEAGVNNTTKTRKRIELISKLVENTDRQYKFVNQEQLKELGYNENANGLTNKETGEILLSVNSNKEIVAVLGHETTHLFDSKVNGEYTQEYKDLQNAVVDYLKANGAYESKINDIMKTYQNAGINLTQEEIMEEVTADTIGDNLFGENSEQFIQQLTANRNVFQKIYDYIKKAVRNIKGYDSEEAKQLQNLKDTFEKVYKTLNNNETDNSTKYSIGGEKALENIRNTQFYKEAMANLEYAKKIKKEEGKNNKELIKETGWYQDQAGDWKFEFSDRDMELKKTNFAINKEYKLSEVLDHDTLFYFYPELSKYTVIFENKSGSYFSKKDGENLISISSIKLNDKVELKGTLIHEIQHAIQNIENHAHGTTAKKGLIRYYNTLGEIEAADTKQRYLNNVKGVKNTILPETAKNNPTHQRVKDGNMLEKMANGIYNYFHGGEKNVYKNKTNLEQNNNKDISLVDKRGRINYSISQDNKGRTLTKEQQEYFKDSKVRDENGNLKELYHGTTFGGFTIFDKSKLGTTTKAIDSSLGFHFTDNEDLGKMFSDSEKIKESGMKIGDNPEVKKTYLNLTNPFNIYKAIENETMANDIYYAITGEDSTDIEDAQELINYALTNRDGIRNFKDELASTSGAKERLIERGYDGLEFPIQETDIMELEAQGYKNFKGNEYVAFNSNQIKNIDNTNPTDNPDIRYSMTQGETDQYWKKQTIDNKVNNIENSEQSSFNLSPENLNNEVSNYNKNPYKNPEQIAQDEDIEKQTNEKIAKILDKPIEKVKEKNRTWAIAKASLIDKGIVFEELSRKTNNRDLQGKWDYTLTSSARGQNAIGNARFEMDSETKTQKQISKSLTDIMDEVGENTSEFQNYMYHLLNIDRMSLNERFGIDNKPVFGDNISKEFSQQKVIEMEEKYPEFKAYREDIYDFLNANKKELVDKGVISKELSDKLSELYPHYIPIKRVNTKGLAIKVPLDTNRTGVNSPLVKATGGNSDIQPLFETIADRTLQTYKASARNSFGVELMNTLNSTQTTNNTDIDKIMEQIGDIDANEELLQEGKNGEPPTFTVFRNGEKTTFEITKDMYDALKPINDSSLLNKTIKPLRTISNLRRGVLTEYNPLFSLTNAVKDVQDVLINSQHPAKTYAKFGESYAQILKKGYWYNEYLQNGGEQNSYFKDGVFENEKKLIFPLNAISSVNNVIEMAPRLAEYIASREAGRSIETSMLDAARVTTNFKAGGDVTKFLNRNGATFLNASVQGFQQQIRNVQEANIQGAKGYAVLATKYIVAGLPALLLNGLIWKDDEDYKELQDYVKDNYYIVGKTGDTFIRIPKGRVAATAQKIVANVTKYVTDDEKIDINSIGKDFWEDLQFAIDNIAPNNPLDNNVISPIIQTISNTSWYGEDIVPTRLQDKPKGEQYDESIDKFSIWLGDKLNISPYKINYLLDQYGGGISDVALPMMTKQAESGADTIIEQLLAPATDKFTANSILKNGNPGIFYDQLDDLKVNANSDKATDKDKLKYNYASKVSSIMSELYKEKREIQNSDLSNSEKNNKIKEIQNEINQISKNGLIKIEDIYNTRKTLDADDLTTVSKTDVLNFIDEQDFTSKQKDTIVNNLYKSSKTTIDMSEYGKYNSYDEYQYARDNPNKYNVISQIDTYDNYNTYKDKITDIKKQYSTDNGYTTSERKSAVQNYIEGLNLDMYQKMMLEHEAGGYSIKEYSNYIQEYLDSTDLTQEEKYYIWEELFN